MGVLQRDFGAPHIVASYVALAHKGYLHHYRWPFAVAVLGALVAAALMIRWLPPLCLVWLLLLLTARHALGQQMEISIAVLKRHASRWIAVWRVLTQCSVAFMIGGRAWVSLTKHPLAGAWLLCAVTSAVGSGSLCAALVLMSAQERHWRSAVLLLATVPLTRSCLAFVALGYPVWFFALPQVVHDLTAFLVDITHERATRTRGWSAVSVVAMPAIGILGAWSLFALSKGSLLILMVTLTHDFLEARAWQRGSLHRQRVS